MRQKGNSVPVFALLLALFLPLQGRAAEETVVPEGTHIILQLNDRLSTKSNKEGDSFSAVVMEAVYQGNQIAIPKGSKVTGSISRIIRPGRFKGKPLMNLLFQSINIPGRGEYAIDAVLERVNSEEGSGNHPEGTVKGEGSATGDIGRVLTPSLIGAGLGGIAGGGRGAGIGAGIGAAAGIGAIIFTRGKDLELSRGSTLDISLNRSLTISASTNDASVRSR